MEAEDNQRDEDKRETKWVDEDKAAKMDGTEEVSKVTDHVTLDELLEQSRVSRAERVMIKEQESLWFTHDLLTLSEVEIITEPHCCSETA